MADAPGYTAVSRPEWFAAFLADRGTRKPSAHTIKAYRPASYGLTHCLNQDPDGSPNGTPGAGNNFPGYLDTNSTVG